jgi:hypothetical protein
LLDAGRAGVVGELCHAAGATVLGRSRVITNVGHTLTYAGIEHPPVDVDVHTTVGLDLTAFPWLDFAVEIAFCVACWMYYRGSRKLLAAILALNIANLPLMLAGEGSASPMAQNPFILPTVMLLTILVAWGVMVCAIEAGPCRFGHRARAATLD